MKRKTPLRSNPEKIKAWKERSRKPLPKHSKKAKSNNLAYQKEKKAYLLWNHICEVCNKNRSRDVHHMRGRIGRLLRDARHWLPVCRKCHNEIHNCPEWARIKGFLAPVSEWNVFQA